LLILTTNDAPGYRITELMGEVSGLSILTQRLTPSGMTKMLMKAREGALEQLSENARQAGANAVIAMRFDSNELGGAYLEIHAYGTAVVIEPLN
jgi:uncharacterized protein YbjQ (UPF0145 family)